MLLQNTIVKEAYYGKSKNLTDAEKICDEIVAIVKKYNGRPSDNLTVKLYKKVAVLLEKEFDIGKLYIIPVDVGTPNVFTLPISVRAFMRRDQSKKNRLDLSSLSINIVVFTQIINHSDFTGGELLATLIHEIGHNLDASPIAIVGLMSRTAFHLMNTGKKATIDVLLKVIPMQELLRVGTNLFGKLYYKVSDDIPESSEIDGSIIKLINTIDEYRPQFTFRKIKKHGIGAFIPRPINILAGASTQVGEKFADSVVTSHGYGPELTTAIMKMEMKSGKGLTKIAMDNNPLGLLIRFDKDFVEYSINLMQALTLFSDHPQAITRATSQIGKLKRELANVDLHPEMKALILEDLKESEALLNGMLNSEENKYASKFIFTTFMNKFFLENTGGKTSFMDFFDKYIED